MERHEDLSRVCVFDLDVRDGQITKRNSFQVDGVTIVGVSKSHIFVTTDFHEHDRKMYAYNLKSEKSEWWISFPRGRRGCAGNVAAPIPNNLNGSLFGTDNNVGLNFFCLQEPQM